MDRGAGLVTDDTLEGHLMLAKHHRLTSAADFASTIRQGGRSGSRTLVAHLRLGETASGPVADPVASLAGRIAPVRVGLVVNKGVGNAVTRNVVKRRLRHVAAARIEALPGGSMLVIRALPEAAGATSAQLAEDLAHTVGRIRSRAGS